MDQTTKDDADGFVPWNERFPKRHPILTAFLEIIFTLEGVFFIVITVLGLFGISIVW